MQKLAIAEGKMLLPFEQRRNTVPGRFQSPKTRNLLSNHLCSQKCCWLHTDAVLHLMVLAVNVRGLCYDCSLEKLRNGKSREGNNWWSSVSSRTHIAQFQSKMLFIKYPVKWTSWKCRGDSISASWLVTVPGQAGFLKSFAKLVLNVQSKGFLQLFWDTPQWWLL